MNQKLAYALGLLAATSLMFVAGPASADAVGPYYATPSWDQTLPANTRFIVLSNFNSQAVLDRETGLVWEKIPSTTTVNGWVFAHRHCNDLSLANRHGWRLPTVQDLASLFDDSVAAPPGPSLPAGSPFTNVSTSTYYWSATSQALSNGTGAWVVNFGSDFVTAGANVNDTGNLAWCVRGGQGVDAQ